MSYTLEIPEDVLRDLTLIREATGIPIRKQIIWSLGRWVEKHRRDGVIGWGA